MRTGLPRFLAIAHMMCRLLGVWRGSIVAAINASPATAEQKANLLALLDTVDTACAAIDATRTVWES